MATINIEKTLAQSSGRYNPAAGVSKSGINIEKTLELSGVKEYRPQTTPLPRSSVNKASVRQDYAKQAKARLGVRDVSRNGYVSMADLNAESNGAVAPSSKTGRGGSGFGEHGGGFGGGASGSFGDELPSPFVSGLNRFTDKVDQVTQDILNFDMYLKNKEIERNAEISSGEKNADGKNASFGQIVGGSILKGMSDANRAFWSGADFILPTDFLGKYDPISAMNQKYADINESLSEKQAYNVEDRSKAAGFASNMGSATVATLPRMMALLFSRGGSEIPSLAPRVAGVANTISAAMKGLGKNPMYWQSFIDTVGGEYESAIANGADPVNASMAAITSSLLGSAVEVSGGMETLPGQLRGTDVNKLAQWFKSGLDEGKEEVLQSLISGVMQKAMADTEKPVFSMENPEAIINPKNLAMDFGTGAGVGLLLGGGQVAADTAMSLRERGKNVMPTATDGKVMPGGGVRADAETAPEAGEILPGWQKNNAAGDYYFDAKDTGNSWIDRTYTQNGKTFIQSKDKTRMYEVPAQSDIKHHVDENGTVHLDDDVVSRIDGRDFRDFSKAYAAQNLIVDIDPQSGQILHGNPVTVKSSGDEVAITQTGINDFAKKLRGLGIKNQDNVASVLLLDKIIENATKIGTAPNKHGRQNPFTQYSGKFHINGRTYSVSIDVANTNAGDRYHYHALNKIEVNHAYGSNGKNAGTYPETMTTSINNSMRGFSENVNSDLQGAEPSMEATNIGARMLPIERESVAINETDAAQDGGGVEVVSGEPRRLKTGTEETRAGDAKARDRAVLDEVNAAMKDWADATLSPKGAEVRTQMPGRAKGSVKDGAHNLYRKLVDSGEAVARMAKAVGDEHLYAYYNFARASSNAAGNMIAKGGAQTDIMGRKVGKSLADIFEPIRDKGSSYYQAFEEYLFHRHNVDRMSRDNRVAIMRAKEALDAFDAKLPDIARLTEGDLERLAQTGDLGAQQRSALIRAYERAKKVVNKPVFGFEVGAKYSQAAADETLGEHPEFAELAETVYDYNRNLMQYRVESGLLTRDQADQIEKIYPHYVPTYRMTEAELARERRSGQRVSKGVGRAQGGEADLMPLHVAMARQTMQVVKNGAVNRFGARMLEDYEESGAAKRFVYDVNDAKHETHPDMFDMLDDPTPKKENTFTIYRDGKAVEMTVDPALYEGVAALSPGKNGVMDADFWKPAEAATRLFKALVTGYNPMFSARNFARDLQEAGLYSKDAALWAANYPQAVKEITTRGDWWKLYKALGGVYSSVFDYQQGYSVDDKEHGIIRRGTLDKIEALNMGIEQATRLAEFMAQAKKHGDSQESLMGAMMAAADVTTNFGRSGEVGKFLNRTFVPFLNPSIQGVDKMARRFLGSKSGKEWGKLIVRCAVLGIAPAILNAMLNADVPEWDNLRQSDKDVNWLISLGDGNYLKIPKGRDISALMALLGQVGNAVQGKQTDWSGALRTVGNQIAPPNPLENNIAAAWMDTDLLDPSSPGKTWYGGDIESQRLQRYAPGQRFDENTDVASKAIGGAVGVSPKKLNYLLDQYSGVIGDFALPLLTPSGNKNLLSLFKRAFVLDGVSSNKTGSDFYDTADEITYAKNAGDGVMSVVARFWNKKADEISKVNEQMRQVEMGGLPNGTMLEQVRTLKESVNGIQQDALGVLEQYEAAVREHYTGDSDAQKDAAYREANRAVFGTEYALEAYDKDIYAKAVKANGNGVSYDDYYEAYFATKTAGGDGAGKTQRMREALLALDGPTADEKAELGRYLFGDKRDLDYSSVEALEISLMDESVRDKAEQAQNAGISQSLFLRAYDATRGITGDHDAYGDSIQNSKSRKLKQAIDRASGFLTYKQKIMLYEMFGVSEKVW